MSVKQTTNLKALDGIPMGRLSGYLVCLESVNPKHCEILLSALSGETQTAIARKLQMSQPAISQFLKLSITAILELERLERCKTR